MNCAAPLVATTDPWGYTPFEIVVIVLVSLLIFSLIGSPGARKKD